MNAWWFIAAYVYITPFSGNSNILMNVPQKNALYWMYLLQAQVYQYDTNSDYGVYKNLLILLTVQMVAIFTLF